MVAFIDQQRGFMERNGADPDASVKRAQLEQAARDGIVLTNAEKALTIPAPPDLSELQVVKEVPATS